jgi:hypothetical protein
MYKNNQGHGICGAKNNYSSTVKLGNYVEDYFGQQLSKVPRGADLSAYKSVTMLSYAPLNERKPLPPVALNIPSPLELKTKIKEGMPYEILFEHGNKRMLPEVRIEPSCFLLNKP